MKCGRSCSWIETQSIHRWQSAAALIWALRPPRARLNGSCAVMPMMLGFGGLLDAPEACSTRYGM